MRVKRKVLETIISIAIMAFITTSASAASLMPYLKIMTLKEKHEKITPLSKVWKSVPSLKVALNIQQYSVKDVQVKGIIIGKTLYIRLKWFDPTKNDKILSPNQFLDGCAVSFPIKKMKGYAPSICMGQIGNEVNIWHWRANMKNHYAANLIAGGPGTLTELKDPYLHQYAIWKNGKWYVEFSRPLKDKYGASFKHNKSYFMAIAIWNGSDHERAMMKSVSNWIKVEIK